MAAQAGAAQVDKMAGAKPGAFDKAAFIAAVRKAIDAASPKNLDEADNLKSSGKAAQVKDQVGGLVGKGKEESAKDIKTSNDAAPDTSQARPKDVKPMGPEVPGPPPAPVAAGEAMPGTRGSGETNLAAGPCSLKAKMDDAKVTDEQLAKGNEPQFNQALDAKKKVEDHAATAPAGVKADEAQQLDQAKAAAGGAVAGGLSGMHATRSGILGHVGGHKDEAKARDEAKRAEISKHIEEIFNKTKTEVTKSLDDLDKKVSDAFDSGEKAARESFDRNVGKDMDAWKDKRYSGLSGAAQWVADKFSGPPPEVNQIFDRNRAAYLAQMDKVISDVADLVGRELGRAKQLIADGRAEVKKFVASQPGALKQFAAEAEQKMSDQFDSLDNDVNSKQDSVVNDLAEKYGAARQSVDDAITKMQEDNNGLVQEAEEGVAGALDTVVKMKDMLLNVLQRAANAIDRIIADPIGFLGKLVDAVKAGLNQFVANIGSHLKKGLLGWLFGALAEAGITLPEKFDLKGILNLVLSILGLTWANIRSRIVAQIGEPVMAKLEQVVDVFKIIVTEGLGGLWKWILEKIGDFKEMIMGQIKDFIQEKVIIAGVTWLIGLLNPAAAFIKACKAIDDVVMFFVEKGQQIKEFVDSILDSVESILGGGVGAVANLIENTLAKIIRLAISFLASLLGLGGIGEKIRSIIEKIQKPVNKAIDTVIGDALKIGKKLFGGLIAKGKGLYAKGKDYVKGKVEAGKAWVKGKVEAGKAWVKGKVAGPKDGEKPPGAPGQPTGDVHADVARDLASQLGGEPSPDKVAGAVETVYNMHAAHGLKTIDVVPKDTSPGEFDVMVAASPLRRVLTFRVSDLQVSFPRTACIVEMTRGNRTENLGKFISGREQAEGDTQHHAEQGMIRLMKDRYFTDQRPKGRYTLTMSLTRSPCGICGPSIEDFKEHLSGRGFDVGITIRILTAYGGAKDVETISVLRSLRENHVKLEVLTLEQIVAEKLLGDPKSWLDKDDKRLLAEKEAEARQVLRKATVRKG